ncbi:hypothetical protein Tco_0905549 [Tanacetum coccineum]
MSRSEPEEMAPKRSKPVVILKFDMHIYTFTLTLKELNQAIKEFFIPMDLRHRLPPPDLTMNKLPNNVIGIYVEQLDQGRMRIPFSIFLLVVISATVSLFRVLYKLCKHGHWFLFENKSGGRAKKCFKEITSSLKGWKKKFFLIDMRAIPKAMTWRHIDTDVRDDFLISYHKSDADRIAKRVILLHKPRHPLLYMCGLTMDFRHSELSHNYLIGMGQLVSKETPSPTMRHASCSYHHSRWLLCGITGKKSGRANLCAIVAGWLGGLSLGHKEEEVAAILPNTSNLDIEGSKVSPDLPSTIAGDQSGLQLNKYEHAVLALTCYRETATTVSKPA